MLKLSTFLLLLVTVCVTSISQILLRHGMSSGKVQTILSKSKILDWELLLILLNPSVLLGLFLYVIGALVWLFILSQVFVSIAYPFIGLGFVITALMGHFLLQEPLSLLGVVGICLIVIGISIIGLKGV